MDIKRLVLEVQIEPLLFDAEGILNKKYFLCDVADYLFSIGIMEVLSVDDLIKHLTTAADIKSIPISKRVILEDGLIPSHIPLEVQKRKYKVSGEIWIVHNTDVDPFPSQPHAHNYEQNLTMHLGNGSLYRKRDYICKAKEKSFLRLRELLAERVSLPPLEI